MLSNENGSALIIVMLVILVFSVLTISISYTIINEVKMASNDVKNKKAFYLAEAGVEEVIYTISNGSPTREDLENISTGDWAGDNESYSVIVDSMPDENEDNIYIVTVTGDAAGYPMEITVNISPGSEANTVTAGNNIVTEGSYEDRTWISTGVWPWQGYWETETVECNTTINGSTEQNANVNFISDDVYNSYTEMASLDFHNDADDWSSGSVREPLIDDWDYRLIDDYILDPGEVIHFTEAEDRNGDGKIVIQGMSLQGLINEEVINDICCEDPNNPAIILVDKEIDLELRRINKIKNVIFIVKDNLKYGKALEYNIDGEDILLENTYIQAGGDVSFSTVYGNQPIRSVTEDNDFFTGQIISGGDTSIKTENAVINYSEFNLENNDFNFSDSSLGTAAKITSWSEKKKGND